MNRGSGEPTNDDLGSGQVEAALRAYYQVQDADPTLASRVWDAVQPNIRKADAPTRRANPRRGVRRRVRVATGLAAGIAAAFLLMAGSFYFAPRWQSYAAAMVNGTTAGASQMQFALRSDPGLLGAFRRGAFQPLHLSTTVDGVTLQLLDFYTDANRTVILYHIAGPSAPPGTLVVEPWQISLGNFAQTSEDTLLGKPAPKLRTYSISLRDQFGLNHHWTGVGAGAGGYGYLQFAPIGHIEQALGLRLTLHVQAMETVRAAKGLFGPRQYSYKTGPWNISFVAIPSQTPSLVLTPNTSTDQNGVQFTLNSVHSSGSETRLMLTSKGLAPPSGQAGGLTFTVTTPGGKQVSFVDSTQSGSRVDVQFPPLVTAGTYRLHIVDGSKRWQLLWSQPKWSGQTSKVAAPGTHSLLYAGRDLAAARKLLDYPVYVPPAGWVVQKVEVTDNEGPVLWGSKQSTPHNLTMSLRGPGGERILVIESRALLSLTPPTESYQAYVNGLARSTHNSVRSVKRFKLFGMNGVEVQFAAGKGTKKQLLCAMALYPVWGSVEIDAIPGAHAATKAQVTQFAQTLLAQKAVLPAKTR